MVDFLKIELVGRTLEEAVYICSGYKQEFRIVRNNDTNYYISMDLNFDRLNLDIDDNVVTKCENY